MFVVGVVVVADVVVLVVVGVLVVVLVVVDVLVLVLVVDVAVLGGEIVVVGAVVVDSSMATVSVSGSEPVADWPVHAVISTSAPTRTSVGCQRTPSR